MSLPIRDRLRALMGSVLGLDCARIKPEDSPTTITEWDSVRHLQLMMAIEDEFGVQFEAEELASQWTVGKLEARLSQVSHA